MAPYKRFWLAQVFAKPQRVTVNGQSGLMVSRSDLIEVDCRETRIRPLQSTFRDHKEWTATDTPEKPSWIFVNPDARNMDTIRHACGGEKLTGEGYPSLNAAVAAYQSGKIPPSP